MQKATPDLSEVASGLVGRSRVELTWGGTGAYKIVSQNEGDRFPDAIAVTAELTQKTRQAISRAGRKCS